MGLVLYVGNMQMCIEGKDQVLKLLEGPSKSAL